MADCLVTQIPFLGTFGPQCLGVVGQFPALVAILVVALRYGAGPVWHRRPVWLRKFAEEETPRSVSDEEAGGRGGASPGGSRAWTSSARALFSLSLVGVVVGVVGVVFSPTSAQLPWMPVVPSVSVLGPIHRLLVKPIDRVFVGGMCLGSRL
jgi:hypothetical protein